MKRNFIDLGHLLCLFVFLYLVFVCFHYFYFWFGLWLSILCIKTVICTWHTANLKKKSIMNELISYDAKYLHRKSNILAIYCYWILYLYLFTYFHSFCQMSWVPFLFLFKITWFHKKDHSNSFIQLCQFHFIIASYISLIKYNYSGRIFCMYQLDTDWISTIFMIFGLSLCLLLLYVLFLFRFKLFVESLKLMMLWYPLPFQLDFKFNPE